ncbi:MAG: asparagine synthase (glutamine-hydrolyzing) [Candidatus Schekmanbacteria bacterium]|nr:asparagine synthase (glutamine-hydrolyzing) [Candidatus Schekmanbacteria bacterium]
MCGIAGFYVFAGGPPGDDRACLDQALQLQANRGPDGTGSYVTGDGHAGVGHRWLKIVDLDPRAKGPLANEDGTIQLVFNGEIYNARGLRTELGRLAHRFRTRSDAEVVVHGYEEWGLEVLPRLTGDWAFGLLDTGKDRIVCARDRFGVRPLHYLLQPGRLAFASAIRALRPWRSCLAPNWPKVADFFLRGYRYLDDGTETFFADVWQVPPASLLIADSQGLAVRRWWRLDPAAPPPPEAELEERLRELLRDAVRIRLPEHWRPAFCVSGGFDSSSLLCLAAEAGCRCPDVLSLQTADPLLDESELARRVARHAGARLHLVRPTGEDLAVSLPELARRHDEPIPAAAWFAHDCLVRAAAQGDHRVVLFGHGLDELGGGYHDHYAFHLADLRSSGNAAQYGAERRAYARLFAASDEDLDELLKRTCDAQGRFCAPLYLQAQEQFHDQLAPELVAAAATRTRRFQPEAPFDSQLKNSLYRDLTIETIPAMMRVEDEACMSVSLENRVPFLDHRVVELLMALPPHLLINGGRTKHALRLAMQGILPEEIRSRTAKRGLNVPLHNWLLGPCRGLVAAIANARLWRETGVLRGRELPPLPPALSFLEAAFYWRALAFYYWYVAHVRT